MPLLLIIADDITGALDTGVQFGKQGILAEIVMHPEDLATSVRQNSGTEVWIINTESRHISPERAAEKVRDAVIEGKSLGIQHFYKKTDSTLRGNLGAELEAFLEATGQDLIPFIPAHPVLNRFTRNGYHYINEEPVHMTSFGQDPLEPVQDNHIPSILKEQTKVEVYSLPHSEIGGKGLVHHQGKGILVGDCQSLDDLRSIVDFIKENDLQFAMSGSAALVGMMPSLLPLTILPTVDQIISGPCLLVNGSLNNISRQQVLYARDHGLSLYSIEPGLLSDPSIRKKGPFLSLLENVRKQINTGHPAIINSTSVEVGEDLHLGSRYPINKHNFKVIASQIGNLVADIVEEIGIKSIIVFGGDTLSAILDKMGIFRITPIKEIMPGVALARMIGPGQTYLLISKPGGYGNNTIIVDIFDHINLA